MRLFLTSGGLANEIIISELESLAGVPKNEIRVAFVPTAANIESGDKLWLIDDLHKLTQQGYQSVDVVDISALSFEEWLPRLEEANILFFGGGNTFHLMHWFVKSGLSKELLRLLETRVYAGISAGSCCAGPTVYNSVQNLFGEKYDLKIDKGLGLVDFHFIPHLNSKLFEKIREENLIKAASNLTEPVYALDDNCAIRIEGDNMDVVGGGTYLVFNK